MSSAPSFTDRYRLVTAQRRPEGGPHTIHGQRGYVVILGLVLKKILVSFGAKLLKRGFGGHIGSRDLEVGQMSSILPV